MDSSGIITIPYKSEPLVQFLAILCSKLPLEKQNLVSHRENNEPNTEIKNEQSLQEIITLGKDV